MVSKINANRALTPEPEVFFVQIVLHALRATAYRTNRLSIDLRSCDAEPANQPIQAANAAIRDQTCIVTLFDFHRDFHATDTVGQTSLIPPVFDHAANVAAAFPIVAHTECREVHHAAHRRSSASFSSDHLTLVRCERLRCGAEQLDAVFTGAVRACIVDKKTGLRTAARESRHMIASVVIDCAHDRVVRGLERTIGGVELGGSHSRLIIPEDGNRRNPRMQGKSRKFLSPIIILSTIAPHGMRSSGFVMYRHAPGERASSRSFRASSSASSRLSITTMVFMSSGAFPLLRLRFHASTSFRQSRSPAAVRGGL